MKNHWQDGFTLIEVIVAVALLAIVIVAILTPMLGMFGFSRVSEETLDLNTLAQQRLEEARAAVAANYATPAAFTGRLATLEVTCQNMGLYGRQLKADCNDTVAAGVPPLRRLTVTVTQGERSLTSTVDVTQ